MISVQEADQIISAKLKIFPETKCVISNTNGRFLREDILADRDAPPFHRVAMDGIAINYSAWQKGNRIFPIEGTQKAGEAPGKLKNENSCLEVMTGAVLPDGTDCVIKIEDLKLENGKAILETGNSLSLFQNVHQMSSDHKKGTVLIKSGEKLLSTHIAIAASVGKSEICISETPRIAIISTGDELVDVDQEVKPFQIRISNSYALQASLKGSGFDRTVIFHIKDDKKELYNKLSEILTDFDVLILSGGVSMGKFDFIPSVLIELGVEKLFHKISQNPGKPFWFGMSHNDKPVFALPGNPVSALICHRRYILPNLYKALNFKNFEDEYSVLAEEVTLKSNLTFFLPVKIRNENGQIKSYPINFNGSGDYASLVKSDGFIELNVNESSLPVRHFSAGTVTPLYRWEF